MPVGEETAPPPWLASLVVSDFRPVAIEVLLAVVAIRWPRFRDFNPPLIGSRLVSPARSPNQIPARVTASGWYSSELGKSFSCWLMA
jgi:hypothetical protein